MLISEVARLGLGAEVLQASSGAEAQALLDTTQPPPDLVVLDYTMPGQTGLDVIRWARRFPRLASVPMVIFTAIDTLSTAEAEAAGASGFIVKPLPPRKLIEKLRSFLAPR